MENTQYDLRMTLKHLHHAKNWQKKNSEGKAFKQMNIKYPTHLKMAM
jgi:hypothetical protein